MEAFVPALFYQEIKNKVEKNKGNTNLIQK